MHDPFNNYKILHAWHRFKHPKDNVDKNIRAAFEVIDSDLLRDFDYFEFIRKQWGLNSLIIAEHDIDFQMHHIQELIDCKKDICAWAYLVYPKTTNLNYPVYAHRTFKNNIFRWIDQNEEFADFYGLGLTKFNFDSQLIIGDLKAGVPFYYLDHHLSSLSHAKNLEAHIHWPEIGHDHR
jgi:hypothetical protein